MIDIDTSKIEPLAERVLDAYKKLLAEKDINASGNLSDTATVDITLNNNKLQVIFNLDHYWKYVEYGRRPGKMPPISAIEEWIKIKPIVPDPINGKIPNNRQLAFMIARKIGREGIPGKKPLTETAYSDETENVIQSIRNEIIRQLNQYLLSKVKD